MDSMKVTKQKKGVIFSFILFLFLFSFISLFTLLQTQSEQLSISDIASLERSKMHQLLGDISSSYVDALGIDSLSYVGNETEQTFSLQGNVQIRSHSALFESFLDEYESGRIVNQGGLSVSHVASTNEYVFYPYDSYLTVDTNSFIYGGGDVSSVESIELNITFDEAYASVSDTFVNDGSGTVVTLRVTDNTSTTYTTTHTLSPTQANENTEYTFSPGHTLTLTYGSGTYGSGTLSLVENVIADVNITGFSVTHSDALTSASGFYTNTSLSFNAISLNFSGNTPLIRG